MRLIEFFFIVFHRVYIKFIIVQPLPHVACVNELLNSFSLDFSKKFSEFFLFLLWFCSCIGKYFMHHFPSTRAWAESEIVCLCAPLVGGKAVQAKFFTFYDVFLNVFIMIPFH